MNEISEEARERDVLVRLSREQLIEAAIGWRQAVHTAGAALIENDRACRERLAEHGYRIRQLEGELQRAKGETERLY